MSARRASCDSLPTTGFTHHGGGKRRRPVEQGEARRRVRRHALLNRARGRLVLARDDGIGARPRQAAALGQLSGEQRRAVLRPDDAVGRQPGELVEQLARIGVDRRRDPARRGEPGEVARPRAPLVAGLRTDDEDLTHPLANLDSPLHARNRRGDGDVKERIAAELEAAQGADDGVARAVLRRASSPSRSLRSCPHSSGTSRTSATSRSCGSRGGSAARRRSIPTRTTRTTRSPTSARSGRRSSCSTRAPRARISTTCGLAHSSARGDRARPGRPAPRGRLRVRPRRPARAAARRDDAADDPALGLGAPREGAGRITGNLGDVAVEAGSFVMGGDDELGLRQRAPRPRGRDRRVQDRRRARLERRLRRLPRRRRLARAAALVGAGWCRVAAAPLRTARARTPTSSPCSTSRGTRRTRTPSGPASACRPRPSGSVPPSSASSAARRRSLGVDVVRLRGLPRASDAFPYPEYSEVFFGPEYKVLRGASWATSETVARVTFRNWDFPIRRQIFAGFRCARPAHERRRRPGDAAGRRLSHAGGPARGPARGRPSEASRRRRRSCRRSGSTTSAAPRSSRRSRGCPSTTSRAASGSSSPSEPTTSRR